jgi:Flp pilus assembly protein TadD
VPPVKNARIVGAARSGSAAAHNAPVPLRPLIRAGTVALCALGVLAGVVTYRSEKAAEDAKAEYLSGGSRELVVDRYEDSRPLNPDAEREIGQATALFELGRRGEAVEVMREAARREPDNARVWVAMSNLMRGIGRPLESRRSWARARELNPRLPAWKP